MEDTGTLAEVPEADRLDEDGGEFSDARTDGMDDNFEDLYANPGEVVDLESDE